MFQPAPVEEKVEAEEAPKVEAPKEPVEEKVEEEPEKPVEEAVMVIRKWFRLNNNNNKKSKNESLSCSSLSKMFNTPHT